jgi:hypothetical protein
MTALPGDIRRTVSVLALLAALGVCLAYTTPAAAQEPVDWRGNLNCEPDHQVFEGVLYCTGVDETEAQTHVLVVDLGSADVAFEYILPKGASDGHSEVRECRDPNVPAWGGPAGGCYVPGRRDAYPTMRLDEAVARARELRSSPALAAVIDSDYGGKYDSAEHGPEGLTVVRRERLDGAARCDDDYNAPLRPWLGLGDGRDPETGQISVTISRLETDSSPVPDWVYTGVGGGPWLVRDGGVVSTGQACRGEKRLDTVTPLRNCTGNPKPDREPPLFEGYRAGACRAAPHTAAGLSRDVRWLFLVITTSERDPDTIARYMSAELGAWWALKFDGGGSSQLWYQPLPQAIDPPPEKGRTLSNFLAVYANSGDGIQLPLEAEPVERVHQRVLTAGETAEFALEIVNSGSLTWHPEDDVELRRHAWVSIGDAQESLSLPAPVAPGDSATWMWALEAKRLSLRVERFQMFHKDQPFGPDVAVVVVGVPPGWEETRQKLEGDIQDLIDEWEQRGEEELDRLVGEITKIIERELNNLWNRLLNELQRFIDELCNSVCGTAGVLLIGALAVARSRGRVSKH